MNFPSSGCCREGKEGRQRRKRRNLPELKQTADAFPVQLKWTSRADVLYTSCSVCISLYICLALTISLYFSVCQSTSRSLPLPLSVSLCHFLVRLQLARLVTMFSTLQLPHHQFACHHCWPSPSPTAGIGHAHYLFLLLYSLMRFVFAIFVACFVISCFVWKFCRFLCNLLASIHPLAPSPLVRPSFSPPEQTMSRRGLAAKPKQAWDRDHDHDHEQHGRRRRWRRWSRHSRPHRNFSFRARAGRKLIHYSCFASVTISAWPCPCAQNLCPAPSCLQPLCPVSCVTTPAIAACTSSMRTLCVRPSVRARARLFVRFSLLPSVSLPVGAAAAGGAEGAGSERRRQPQPQYPSAWWHCFWRTPFPVSVSWRCCWPHLTCNYAWAKIKVAQVACQTRACPPAWPTPCPSAASLVSVLLPERARERERGRIPCWQPWQPQHVTRTALRLPPRSALFFGFLFGRQFELHKIFKVCCLLPTPPPPAVSCPLSATFPKRHCVSLGTHLQLLLLRGVTLALLGYFSCRICGKLRW